MDKLADNLKPILDYIKQGVEFATAQAPLVAQEYLRYNLLTDWIWIFLDAVVVVLLVRWAKWLHKLPKNEYEDREFHYMGIMGAVIASFGFAIGFIYCILDLIKIYTAPRLYLLEGIKSLVGG
jgi:hypothetical protein